MKKITLYESCNNATLHLTISVSRLYLLFLCVPWVLSHIFGIYCELQFILPLATFGCFPRPAFPLCVSCPFICGTLHCTKGYNNAVYHLGGIVLYCMCTKDFNACSYSYSYNAVISWAAMDLAVCMCACVYQKLYLGLQYSVMPVHQRLQCTVATFTHRLCTKGCNAS